MNVYTPTVELLKASLVYLNAENAKQKAPEADLIVVRREAAAQFDRMIAEVERAAAEKAYEQGVIDGKRSSELYLRYQSGDLSEREYARLMASTNRRAEAYRQERKE